MALIRCDECNREISNKATVCIGCGAPVNPTPQSSSAEDENSFHSTNGNRGRAFEIADLPPTKKYPAWKIIVWIIGVIFLVEVIVEIIKKPEIAQHGALQSTPAQTPSEHDVTANASSTDNNAKHLSECLLANAKAGDYSSLDGGKSSIRLLGQCPQWQAYVDSCIQSGKEDGVCTLQAGILAQAALKLVNK